MTGPYTWRACSKPMLALVQADVQRNMTLTGNTQEFNDCPADLNPAPGGSDRFTEFS